MQKPILEEKESIVAPASPVAGHQNGLSDALTDAPTFGKYTLTAQGLRANDGSVVATLSDGTVFTTSNKGKPVRFYHKWFLPVVIDGKDAVIDESLQRVLVNVAGEDPAELLGLNENDTLSDDGGLMQTAYPSNQPEIYLAATVLKGDELKECYVCIWGDGRLSVARRKVTM